MEGKPVISSGGLTQRFKAPLHLSRLPGYSGPVTKLTSSPSATRPRPGVLGLFAQVTPLVLMLVDAINALCSNSLGALSLWIMFAVLALMALPYILRSFGPLRADRLKEHSGLTVLQRTAMGDDTDHRTRIEERERELAQSWVPSWIFLLPAGALLLLRFDWPFFHDLPWLDQPTERLTAICAVLLGTALFLAYRWLDARRDRKSSGL